MAQTSAELERQVQAQRQLITHRLQVLEQRIRGDVRQTGENIKHTATAPFEAARHGFDTALEKHPMLTVSGAFAGGVALGVASKSVHPSEWHMPEGWHLPFMHDESEDGAPTNGVHTNGAHANGAHPVGHGPMGAMLSGIMTPLLGALLSQVGPLARDMIVNLMPPREDDRRSSQTA